MLIGTWTEDGCNQTGCEPSGRVITIHSDYTFTTIDKNKSRFDSTFTRLENGRLLLKYKNGSNEVELKDDVLNLYSTKVKGRIYYYHKK